MRRIEKFILRKIKLGEYVITSHAWSRMNERHVTGADIIEVARTVRSIQRQDQNDTYLITGLNTWGEKLMMSVAVRDKVIIVTVFLEE